MEKQIRFLKDWFATGNPMKLCPSIAHTIMLQIIDFVKLQLNVVKFLHPETTNGKALGEINNPLTKE